LPICFFSYINITLCVQYTQEIYPTLSFTLILPNRRIQKITTQILCYVITHSILYTTKENTVERERRQPNQTAPGISIPIPPRQKQILSRILAPKVRQDLTGMLSKKSAATSIFFFIIEVYGKVTPDIRNVMLPVHQKIGISVLYRQHNNETMT